MALNRLLVDDDARPELAGDKDKKPRKITLAELLERVPPHDADAEAAVLGSMIIDSSACDIALEELKKSDFYIGRHQTLFDELRRLFAQVENLDELIVRNHIKRAGLLEAVGGPDAIARLVEQPHRAASVESYIKIVREFALTRELLKTAAQILLDVKEPAGREAEALLDEAAEAIYRIWEHHGKQDAVLLLDILNEIGTLAQEAVLARRENREIPNPAISTRFVELDLLLAGGMRPGELIILAGRPSMGKTTFAINIARKIASDQPDRAKPVAIFSLEMPKQQVAKNILAAQCGEAVPNSGQKLRNFNLTDDEYAEVVQASRVLEVAQIHIDDSSGLTVEQLRARCRRLKQRFGIQLVVVDYLQLLQSSNANKKGNRQEEVSEISRGLKSIARDLELPMIVLSQLNRSMEKRDSTDKTDKRPALSDLRDSGAIEQDADVVIMLYREEYYNMERNQSNVNVGEALVLKNRNGQVGKARLIFFKDQLRFENYAPEHDTSGGG